MKRIKYIAVLGCISIILTTALLLSFYMPQEKQAISQGTFRIEKIVDTIASAEPRVVRFATYDSVQEAHLQLILSGTYGTITLSPETTSWDYYFSIPAVFNRNAGKVSYTFLQDHKTIQEGSYLILADTTKLGTLETHLGPRSIVANERDYTMLVSIPTDTLDNILPDGTLVQLKNQFKNTTTASSHPLSSGIAWKRVAAPLQSGRMSTASILNEVSSRELVADIFPDVAQDFSIRASSNHNYADGNEIITFQTSQITDTNGNIMTDGTLVTFSIKDGLGSYWQVKASTVNGYAFAKALHPQSPSTWIISAAITGIAQSEEIRQSFAPIIDTIPVTIKEDRTIIVGPLTSYLGQLVQEGIDVSLSVGGIIYNERTKSGKATFVLKQENHPKGAYTVHIKTLGIAQKQQLILD